jgi:hypothetical protein
MRASPLAFLLSVVSCSAPEAQLVVSTPQALLDCAELPALRAELMVSGVAEPCTLEVDLGAGTTSGDCDIPTGLTRTIVIDWLVDVDNVRVVVAQVRKELDVTTAGAETTLVFVDDDIITQQCTDRNGGQTQVVGNASFPICDLDDDGTSNVVEVCGGLSPFRGGL